MRAAVHGRSMEEEAREILKTGLAETRVQKLNLAESIRRHVAPLGGVELVIPRREAVRRPSTISE
jgi:plasmid stability protein